MALFYSYASPINAMLFSQAMPRILYAKGGIVPTKHERKCFSNLSNETIICEAVFWGYVTGWAMVDGRCNWGGNLQNVDGPKQRMSPSTIRPETNECVLGLRSVYIIRDFLERDMKSIAYRGFEHMILGLFCWRYHVQPCRQRMVTTTPTTKSISLWMITFSKIRRFIRVFRRTLDCTFNYRCKPEYAARWGAYRLTTNYRTFKYSIFLIWTRADLLMSESYAPHVNTLQPKLSHFTGIYAHSP